MKIIFVILIAFTNFQLIACGDAYQLRFFPIGTSDNKIIFVETSLNRYWEQDTTKVNLDTRDRWRGVVTLKSLDKKGVYTIIQVIDSVDFLDKDYIKGLKIPISKAFTIAKKFTNFDKAENQVIEFCNFKTNCETLHVRKDTVNSKLFVVTVDKKEIEIKYPEILVEESEKSGGIHNQSFKINSIRKIKIGDTSLIVVDFGSGEEQNTKTGFQANNQQQCSSPTDCIYNEIVMYHGQSFDMIIWN